MGTKVQTFELLRPEAEPGSSKEFLFCRERNGRVGYELNGDEARINSFSVDISKDHMPIYLVHQALEHLNDKGAKSCKISSSISQEFNKILESFGFLKSKNGEEYENPHIGERNSHLIQEQLVFPKQRSSVIFKNIPCRFVNELAPESEENTPFLDIYLSQSVSTQTLRTRIPSSTSTETMTDFLLYLEFDAIDEKIDPDSCLNFDCFAQLKNKHGEPCVNQAGCARVPLNDLLRLSMNPSDTIERRIELALQVPASPDVIKSKLILKLEKGCIELKNTQISSRKIRHEIDPAHVSAQISRYIQSCVATYNQPTMQPTWKVVSNIHAYEYTSRVGVLPAVMFNCFEVPRGTESFWLNIIDIVLRRDGTMGLEAFSRGEGDAQFEAKIMAACCSVYVNYCKYITDKVDTNNRTARHQGRKKYVYNPDLVKLIESFDKVRPRNAGDCEDFALEALIEAFEILHLMSSNGPSVTPNALRRISNARSKYYAFCALGAVGSATINYDYGKLDAGAHEWLLLIPKHYWYECLKRTMGNKPHAFLRPEDQNMGKDVTVMVVEGTGMLQPDGKGSESNPELRKRIESEPAGETAFDNLRKMYYYDRVKGSNFYQIVVTLFTNEFLSSRGPGGPRIGEFLMTYKGGPRDGSPAKIEKVMGRKRTPLPQREDSHSYGVAFTHVTTKDDSVCIYPQVAIPEPLFQYMRHLQENEHPVSALETPINTSKMVSPSESIYELVARGTELKLLAEKRPELFQGPVEYFMRYDQATQQRIEAILNVLESYGGYVDVHREPVAGETVGGYRLLIYLDRKSVL